MQDVHKRLIALRGDRTQKEIAKIAGVSETAYRSWEKGEITPKPDKAIRLAEYYGTSLDYIYRGVCHIQSQLTHITDREVETILKALDALAGDDRGEYQKYLDDFKDIYWDLG